MPNGADAIAQVEWFGEGDGSGTVSLGFARDDVTGTLGAFRTEVVNLGTDPDGDAITTLLIDEMDPTETPTKRTDSRKLPDNQGLMLDVVRNLSVKAGEPVRPIPEMPIVSAFRRSSLRAELIATGWFSEGHLLSNALQGGAEVSRTGLSAEHNALRGLKRRGFLAFTREFVWLI